MHNKYKRTNGHFPKKLEYFNINVMQDSDNLSETSVRALTLITDRLVNPFWAWRDKIGEGLNQ